MDKKVTPRQPLHNFGCLKWGVQRQLLCIKPSNNSSSSAATSQPPQVPLPLKKRRSALTTPRSPKGLPLPKVSFEDDSDEDIAEVGEKLMHDLRKANDKMKDELIRKNFGISKKAYAVESQPSKMVEMDKKKEGDVHTPLSGDKTKGEEDRKKFTIKFTKTGSLKLTN